MSASTESTELIDRATTAANAIVQRNFSAIGVAASVDGYLQVWARDSMITLLGAALDATPNVLTAFRVTLSTLASYQDRFGAVPYLVAIQDRQPEFGSTDGNPWFVIGAAHYVAMSGDRAWITAHADALVRALAWCESLDHRKRGLMQSGECGDWADLLSNHGNVLFPNVLYARALEAGAALLEEVRPVEAAAFRKRREVVVQAIQRNFWINGAEQQADGTHEKTRALMSITLRRRPYFLPWVDGFAFGERFDVTANLLAAITGIATTEQRDAILDYVEQAGLHRPYPVRVLYPPIRPGEADWREYYKIYNLNLPDQYHNGGIWPWVGGLYVATLAVAGRRERAREELVMLAEALRQGREEWECNEWLHGLAGRPMGAKYQAWSAGMFLYARHAVETGQAPALAL